MATADVPKAWLD